MALFRLLNKYLILCCSLTLFFCSSAYSAYCQYWPDVNAGPYLQTVSFGVVSVDPNLPIGAVLAEKVTPLFTNSSTIGTTCSGNPSVTFKGIGNYSTLSRIDKLYLTNLAGIGIRIKNFNDAGGIRTAPQSYTYPDDHYRYNNTMTVSLLKLKVGPVESGTLTPGEIASNVVNNTSGPQIGPMKIAIANMGSSVIQSTACTPIKSTQNVNLGNVNSSDFTNVGSVSETIPIDISFNCPNSIKMQFKLSSPYPITDSSNAVLSLDSASTAKGVGIQVLYNNLPVLFNSNIDAGSSDSSGTKTLNFRAHYYKTMDKINPGSADSLMNLSLVYD